MGKLEWMKNEKVNYEQHVVEKQRERKSETDRREDWEADKEERNHRCGGASGNTSHYGVNCSSGDVVERAQRSPSWGVSSNICMHTQKQTHTQRNWKEHLDMCHLPRGSHLVYTQCKRGFVPSWMCNLHASAHHWERMEDKVESEERANQVPHFTGIKC